MARKKQTCRFEGCNNPVKYIQSRTCIACYNSLHYWLKKGATKILKRQERLELFKERMESLTPAKVTRIKRKKRAA